MIWYHGTTEQNAQTILREGFRSLTFFARHMEDALGYGGDFIFSVYFESEPADDGWQRVSGEAVPSSRILELVKVNPQTLYTAPKDAPVRLRLAQTARTARDRA